MIELDTEILQILREMQGSINNIEAKVNSLETKFDSLESRFDSLESRFDSLEKDVKEIKSTVNVIYDQTVSLTEFKTEANKKLDKLIDLENVTKDNCYEIAKLKTILH